MSISQQYPSTFNHFEIVNMLSREVNIKAPSLYQDSERSKILEILLGKQDAVEYVQAMPDMASVVIQFDPVKLPQSKLLVLLETVLNNIGGKVSKTLHNLNKYADDKAMQQQSQHILNITGLKCECCAMSLQMNLKRESGIDCVQVDYATHKATISGNISASAAIDLIIKHGYQLSRG